MAVASRKVVCAFEGYVSRVSIRRCYFFFDEDLLEDFLAVDLLAVVFFAPPLEPDDFFAEDFVPEDFDDPPAFLVAISCRFSFLAQLLVTTR